MYNADSMVELNFPENVRQNPWMLGGRGPEAKYRAVKEIIDNSIDEVMAGFGKSIIVIYDTQRRTILVSDNGRGIPMSVNKTNGKYGSEITFCTLHGSGKFNSDAYANGVIGVHGVGAACTNAVSSNLTVWSTNTPNHNWMCQQFSKGIVKGKPFAANPPLASKGGTEVLFRLDPEIFGDTSVDLNLLFEEMRFIVSLNTKLKVTIVVDGHKTVIYSKNGLLDLINPESEKDEVIGNSFVLSIPNKCDVSLSWHDDSSTSIFSFVNSSHTIADGKHVDGLRSAMYDVFKEELGDKNIDPKYMMYGLRAAINYRTTHPNYVGQTKDRLTNSEAFTEVKNYVLSPFSEFLKNNKSLFAELSKRGKKFQTNVLKMQEENASVKSIVLHDPTARGILSSKLTQSHGYSPDEKELIIVEGDSAGGTAKKARMPWQEILPLRGKIANPIKKSTASFVANEEINAIFTALGIEPGGKFNSPKRRVARVCFLPDADPDGKHIGSELTALFTRYAPDWLDKGKVFYIMSPLFIGSHNGVKKYGNTSSEVLKQFSEKERSSVLITRAKGWGEINPEDLSVIALDPRTRSIARLIPEDGDDAIVYNLMGKDEKYRKRLLGINSNDESDSVDEDD